MRVFVTGATGWIGSHVFDELLANGHEVIGLARSDASAEQLAGKSAAVLRGDLDDLDALRRGAGIADGVVHLANKHDFANPAVSNAAERAATETLGDALTGTGKPLVLASGVAAPNGGVPLTEDVPSPFVGPDSARGGSERLALEYVEHGVRTVVARFSPTVHGTHDHGFVAQLVEGMRRNGEALFSGDGSSRWPAVHVSDAARLVRLGLESAAAGTIMHAVAEEGVAAKDIAGAIGSGLGLPVRSVDAGELAERLGFIGQVFAMDIPASSVATRALLGWEPTGPGLLEDIVAGAYFPV